MRKAEAEEIDLALKRCGCVFSENPDISSRSFNDASKTLRLTLENEDLC